MTDRIDIHEPMFELCRRLGLDPETVSEIIIRPTDVQVAIVKVTDDGWSARGMCAFKVQT